MADKITQNADGLPDGTDDFARLMDNAIGVKYPEFASAIADRI